MAQLYITNVTGKLCFTEQTVSASFHIPFSIN